MLIDAGYPGDRDDVLDSLRHLGYLPGDVRAILLTHAHIDHLASAIWFAKTIEPRSTVTATRSATPSGSTWSRPHRSMSR
jgi:glyoxylase-like metal-dependent hydrolase (beta-lactamase superfamily II)